MKVHLTYLKDIYQMNFIAVKVSEETVAPYLLQLKSHLNDRYDTFIENQRRKSLNNYYINVINSSEYNSLLKKRGIDKLVNSLDEFLTKTLDVTLLGLGKAQSNQNEEWFIVIKSEHLDEIRRYYGLPSKDFIITLAFYPGEVHGVRKRALIPMKDPFIGILKQNYENSDNSFNFLKDFEFFDYDKEKQIDVIKIEDNHATFRVEQNYFTVSLVNDSLRITAKWNETKNKPKLSDTIISRKLKKI